MVAKVNLPMCEFVFENLEDTDEELYPVTLIDPKTNFRFGTLFLKLNYRPLDSSLMNPAWTDHLLEASKLLNKYEYINDHL